MSTTISTGWLTDNNGEKFAPKTLMSQVVTNEGVTLVQKSETDLTTLKTELDSKFTEHINDADTHVTIEEKTKWDSQVDWDETDSVQLSYIKNKPFGKVPQYVRVINKLIELANTEITLLDAGLHTLTAPFKVDFGGGSYFYFDHTLPLGDENLVEYPFYIYEKNLGGGYSSIMAIANEADMPLMLYQTELFIVPINETYLPASAKCAKKLTGDEYSSTSTYTLGEYCIYNNSLYKCTTAIDVAEEWDETKWEVTTIINEIKSINTTDNLFNKNILIVGDSVMAGYGWEGGFKNLIQDTFPNAEVYNYAITSNSMTNGQIYAQIVQAKEDGIVPDIILINGGCNDMINGCTLGTVNETELINEPETYDFTTIAGAMEGTFSAIYLYNYSNVKIGYMNIYKVQVGTYGESTIPDLTTQKEVWDLTKQVCNKWSIPYLDLYNSCGLDANNYVLAQQYFADGIHINEAGYRYLWSKVKQFLLSL